jgi:hypothetical protein
MVEAELVTDDIASGEEALKALDQERVNVRSAFWFYDRDPAEYRLILAMPTVDREGPSKAYKLVQRALLKHRVDLPLRRIVVMGVNEPLPKGVRRALGSVPADTEGESIRARIGRRVVDGLIIEDAYVYRAT